MTSRERWTVYPLLFLAIGLALRAVAVPPDTLKQFSAVVWVGNDYGGFLAEMTGLAKSYKGAQV